MVFWAIIRLENGQFTEVYAPYNSQMEAFNHLDKLKAKWNDNRFPLIRYEWKVAQVMHPETLY